LRRLLMTTLALSLTAPGVVSAASPLLEDGDTFITVDDWKDRVLGKTVYYFIDGQFFGREYYAQDGQSARFQHVSGACADGTWGYDAATQVYCLAWPSSTSCFHHILRDGATLIIASDPDGEGEERPQTVGSIADGGFTCQAGLTS